MTQRIFDVDNPQDVKELFDIIPDRYIRITRDEYNNMRIWSTDCGVDFFAPFAINWHNKTVIARPVDGSKLIGCLCWFWDYNEQPRIAVMKRIGADTSYKYITTDGDCYKYCRPVRRDEVQFASGKRQTAGGYHWIYSDGKKAQDALKVAIDALSKIDAFNCHSKGAIEIMAGMVSIANTALYEITSITKQEE